MERDAAVEVVGRYSAVSDRLLIADLYEPESLFRRMSLHLDELPHYGRFRAYLHDGGTPGLIEDSSVRLVEEHDTEIPCVKIWLCEENRSVTT